MTYFLSDTVLFTQAFCIGMAIVTFWEMIQSYPYLIKENRKQVLLGVRRIPRLNPISFIVFASILSVSLLLISFETFKLPLLLLSLALYFLVYGQLEFLSRKTNLYPFVLFFLSFIPLIEGQVSSFTGDDWTVLFIKTTLSLVYLSSFIQKLKKGIMSWFNGNKLKKVLRYHDLLNGSYWFARLNRYSALLKGVSLAVLLFEAIFWTSIFFPEYDFFFGTAAILFHLVILIFFKINYIQYYFPILLIYFV